MQKTSHPESHVAVAEVLILLTKLQCQMLTALRISIFYQKLHQFFRSDVKGIVVKRVQLVQLNGI